MKEFHETIAAAIAACGQTLNGVFAHLIAVRAELWQLLGLLPLLFACVIKVRESRSGDSGNDKVPPPETRHGQASMPASASVEEDFLPAAKESTEEVICDPLTPSPPASGGEGWGEGEELANSHNLSGFRELFPAPPEAGERGKEGLATPLQHFRRQQLGVIANHGQDTVAAAPGQFQFQNEQVRDALPKSGDALKAIARGFDVETQREEQRGIEFAQFRVGIGKKYTRHRL